MSAIQIEIADRQPMAFDAEQLSKAIRVVLQRAGIDSADISLAVLDNDQIQALNRQYLSHDYATDVLSFCLADNGTSLQGEVIVSAEMANQVAPDYGWSTMDELTLYVIHGTLHLVGMEDATDQQRQQMRRHEDQVLAQLGIQRGNTHSTGQQECNS